MLILVIVGGIGYMVYHNNHKTKTVTASTKSSSQATESADNTARANDASSIMAAFSNFQGNNEGNPPTTVTAASSDTAYLCASTNCDSSDSSVANLDFYKPQNIFIKFKSLTVPDDSNAYITGGVACVNDKAELAEDDSITSVVYAIQNGSSITQQCVSES